MFPWPTPLAGDHLLYGVSGWDLFNRVTRLKTWSPAVHIELYIDDCKSVASRNGLGVNMYPFREGGLIGILRPKQLLDIERGLAWFNKPFNKVTHDGVRGRPYGWLDLLQFINIQIQTDGWICSQFVSLFDEACLFYPFSEQYNDGKIDPGDYFVSNAFTWEWVDSEARKLIQKF